MYEGVDDRQKTYAETVTFGAILFLATPLGIKGESTKIIVDN